MIDPATISAMLAPMALYLGISVPTVAIMPAQFCPRTVDGRQVRAWSYTTGPYKFAIGLNAERADEDGQIRYVLMHEVCHIRLHPLEVDHPTKLTPERYARMEREADACAAHVDAELRGMP